MKYDEEIEKTIKDTQESINKMSKLGFTDMDKAYVGLLTNISLPILHVANELAEMNERTGFRSTGVSVGLDPKGE